MKRSPVHKPSASDDGAGSGAAIPQNPDNGANHTRPPTGPLSGVAGLPLVDRQPLTPDEVVRSFRARRRLLLWAGVLLLSVVLVIETSLLAPWADATANMTPRAISAIPLAETNPYGVNVFLHKEVDLWKKEKTLDMARDLGATWIKQQFPWAEIEIDKNSYYDTKNNQSAWQKFDDLVELAEQRGLRIIARIDSTPAWARADDDMPKSVQDYLRSKPKAPPSASHFVDFGRFIETFVKRYKGRVQVLQIWNEPNLVDEWATGVNAKDYVSLLQTAYLAAKGVDPNVVVLAAPLATTNEQLAFRGNLNELDYLQAMYYAGARPYFDAMSANAYGKEYPPEDPPSSDKLNFRRVELLRKVMETNGDKAKSVWFNEYGWNASPESIPAEQLPWGRVSSDQQADYTVRGIQYARDNWPWAGVFTIWYLRQVGDIPADKSEFYFNLVNPEFVPTTAYKEIQKAANKSGQIATPGDWGPLSAAVRAGPRWQINLDKNVLGGVFVSPSASTVDDSISMTFQGTDVSLLLVPLTNTDSLTTTTAANPINARYYVTVDGSSSEVASDLPRDGHGQAYLDRTKNNRPTEVTLVRGLNAEFNTSSHTLQITVGMVVANQSSVTGSAGVASPTSQPQAVNLPGIGAIKVEARRSYVLFALMTIVLIGGIAVQVWALSHMRRTRPVALKVEGSRLKAQG